MYWWRQDMIDHPNNWISTMDSFNVEGLSIKKIEILSNQFFKHTLSPGNPQRYRTNMVMMLMKMPSMLQTDILLMQRKSIYLIFFSIGWKRGL